MTLEEKKAVLEQVDGWDDAKVERLLRKLLEIIPHAVKTLTPNLINPHDSDDLITLGAALGLRVLEKDDSLEEAPSMNTDSPATEVLLELTPTSSQGPVESLPSDEVANEA